MKVVIYCNSVTRQRLSRTLRTFIEYNTDALELRNLLDSSYELLKVILLGRGVLNIAVAAELGQLFSDLATDKQEIQALAGCLMFPWSRKCWSMKPENFERWARKSSVLAVY